MYISFCEKVITRTLLTAAATVLGLGLGTGSVSAQEEEIEMIVVTGSRIARDPNLGAPVSVQSVSSEDIQLSGKMDVAEVVRTIPALSASETADGTANPAGSAFDSDESAAGASFGEALLQLRGMGLERTLVLVDGRRHVPGATGTSAVDINTIPQPLIERVEVLTGGASAIYGADAVTGVVNFIMKDEYEGLEVNVQGGISSEGDGEEYRIGGIWGTNFAGDRGNFTVAVDYRKREPLRMGDRDWSRDNGIGSDDSNPDLRFQAGDITGDTPLFQQFYSTAIGNFPYGFNIPTADAFVDNYNAAFPGSPITAADLSAGELALIDRAANAPSLFIGRHRTFSISNEEGVIVPSSYVDVVDFDGGPLPGLDLDGNGVDDCLDSHLGYNSQFFQAGGCWIVEGSDSVRPYRDGLIAGAFNQFGGDGIHATGFDPDYITADDQKFVINLGGRYDLTDTVSLFAEFKWVDQETELFDTGSNFFDLLPVAPDNPFIPTPLLPIVAASTVIDPVTGNAEAFRITRDPNDLGGDLNRLEREISRFVIGIEGEFENGWGFEFSLNRGQTNITQKDGANQLMDRYYAAIDVTTDGSGNPICRSDIDPSYPNTSPFGFPAFDFGYFTFSPGDGTCVPLNILGGEFSASQEAIDWIMVNTEQNFKMEQTVFQGIIDGELPFGFDAGDVAFAAGSEFRIEKSSAVFDPLTRGVCPGTGIDCAEGQLVRDLTVNPNNSLVFDPEFLVNNEVGTYDVWEVFGEVEVPLVAGATFAEELTVGAAARFSQYSNVGDTFTWQGHLVWAPVEDIRFRSTLSRAIRAPNITELFAPEQAQTFRPDDPCEQSAIDTLIAAGDPTGNIRAANCAADGIPVGFQDPLSARFSGVTSGNADLLEEEADTITFGFVLTPTFLEGLTVSIDYWDIEIKDAIEFVSDQDIVDNCYDSANFPNQFCGQFSRIRDPNSAQFLGLNFLRQTQLNFGKIESDGVDFAVDYVFELGASTFDVGVQGTVVNKLDEFFDPGDPTAIDDELGELRRPELAGTAYLGWSFGPVYVRWQSLYMDKQTLADVEIDTVAIRFGANGFSDDFWSHDLSANWDFNDNLRFYGGINNITDEIPFLTETAYPVGPRGRYFFLGANYSM
ncbi:MAG: TonB-dependent receptor [Woeseiaceae bacterium]|nr:TonB-dependent receptor [Woeseiaceae bacterium]